MTRTFVAGGEAPPAELQEYWELTRASLAAVMPLIKPGAVCREISRRVVRAVRGGRQADRAHQAAGHRRSRRATTTASATGSGSRSTSARTSAARDETLIAGDVVTVEPGCYRPGFGGCRLEDLVLVTEDGAEVLTDFPYLRSSP